MMIVENFSCGCCKNWTGNFIRPEKNANFQTECNQIWCEWIYTGAHYLTATTNISGFPYNIPTIIKHTWHFCDLHFACITDNKLKQACHCHFVAVPSDMPLHGRYRVPVEQSPVPYAVVAERRPNMRYDAVGFSGCKR